MLLSDQPVGFYVDVNSANEDGKVGTTLLAALDRFDVERRGLRIGAAVRAIDADDNVCAAMVVDRKGMWLELQLDESTWQPLPSAAGHHDMSFSLGRLDPRDTLRALMRTSTNGRGGPGGTSAHRA